MYAHVYLYVYGSSLYLSIDPWEIEELKISAGYGVTLRGVATTTFGKHFGDETRISLRMSPAMHDPDEMHLCITLPPQKWGIKATYSAEGNLLEMLIIF